MSIIFTRRNRRHSTEIRSWEPTIRNPYRGQVIWTDTDPQIQYFVTLYRDDRDQTYEDKDWNILVYEHNTPNGLPRKLACTAINLSRFADPTKTIPVEFSSIKLNLQPLARKHVEECHIRLSLVCMFLKEGKATYVRMIISLINRLQKFFL